MAYKGSDISSWQGNIDIKTLSTQLDFFIFRAYAGMSKDMKVDRNVQLAIENNKPYGLYLYSYALNEAQAIEEANRMVNLANSYIVKPTFLCIDMEDADGYKQRYGMPSNAVLRAICRVACEVFENAGYYANIYASASWFNNQLNGSELNRYDKWIARWTTRNGKQTGNDTPSEWESANNCGIWQYTSEGTLYGYNGYLDMNYAYKNFVLGEKIPTPTPTPNEPDYTGTINYQTYTKYWLKEVNKVDNTNEGYAGDRINYISGIRCKPQYGELKIMVHTINGGWLEEISSNNYLVNDMQNGDTYAGIYGQPIDCVKIKTTRGFVDYRVLIKKGKSFIWLDWVRNYKDYTDEYAGLYGYPIYGIQMK